jgi:hypothetical protein
MSLAGKVESKIMGLAGGRISRRSGGRTRDPNRAMGDAVRGERSNIKAFRARRGARRRRESSALRLAVQSSKDRTPSIPSQKRAKIDARRAFPAIQRPRHRLSIVPVEWTHKPLIHLESPSRFIVGF